MSQTVGDAYIWLATPFGRLLSRGSREKLLLGLQDRVYELQASCEVVVIIAHSQGAAIAVEALKEQRIDVERLITVGGGHRLLAEITNVRTYPRWGRILISLSKLPILVSVVIFLVYYAFWLIAAITMPLLPLRHLLEDRPSGVMMYEAGVIADRFADYTPFFGRSIMVLTMTVAGTCLVYQVFALFGIGRLRLRAQPTLLCAWTELWSRFDPVSIGPRVRPLPEQRKTARETRYLTTKRHQAIEVWNLRAVNPLFEHVTYFSRGSSTLRVIASDVASFLYRGGVSIALPATPSAIKVGRRWLAAGRTSLLILSPIVFLWLPGFIDRLELPLLPGR